MDYQRIIGIKKSGSLVPVTQGSTNGRQYLHRMYVIWVAYRGPLVILRGAMNICGSRNFWKEVGAASHHYFCPPFNPERGLQRALKMAKNDLFLGKISDPKGVGGWGHSSPKSASSKDTPIDFGWVDSGGTPIAVTRELIGQCVSNCSFVG